MVALKLVIDRIATRTATSRERLIASEFSDM